ncbi:MAG: chromate transporter [Limnochordia bacterium]|nr:chromate transporter [Limnochordia bacterium]
MEAVQTQARRDRLQQVFEIFATFFKIGFFTIGGGYAMIPLIKDETVDKKGWISDEDIIDIFAVSESMPGSISVNSATLLGYRLAGFAGAIGGMLGVVLPSFVILSCVAAFASELDANPVITAAFWGIRCCVVGLILHAAIDLIKLSVQDAMGILLVIGTVLLVVGANVHAIFATAIGLVVGIVRSLLSTNKPTKGARA